MTGTEEDGTGDNQLPEGWPTMYNAAGPSCNHAYHWDDSEALYRCVYCGDTEEEPSVKAVAIDKDELRD
jgi:hypothetical protein